MNEFTPVELAKLADYLAGASDEAETTRIERWKEESPERDRFLTMLAESRIDYSAATAETIADLPAQLQMLSESLGESIRTAKEQEHTIAMGQRTRRRSDLIGRAHIPWIRRPMAMVALGATLALLIMAAWSVPRIYRDTTSLGSASIYTTNNGERASVTLADGSTIMLNVGSQVEVPIDYAIGSRTVTLKGQAYFTVASNNRLPFIVLAGSSTTRVLGTRFVVRNYDADSAVTVFVEDGKVAVGDTVVTPNKQVSVTASGISPVRTADGSLSSFVKGVLTLTKVPLPAAIPDLNRWYNVDIRLGDASLETREVDGGFVLGSAVELQSILELMYDVKVVRNNRMLILFPRGQ